MKDLVKAHKLTIVETITSTKVKQIHKGKKGWSDFFLIFSKLYFSTKVGWRAEQEVGKKGAGRFAYVSLYPGDVSKNVPALSVEYPNSPRSPNQVNTSGEANKNGLEPKEAVAAAEFIEQRWKCVIVCLWLEARVLILESLENKQRFQMSQFFGKILEFLASPKHFHPQLPQLEADWSDDDWRSGKQRGCLHYGEWVYGQKHVSPSRTFFLATTLFFNPPSKKFPVQQK